jgi:glycosyltransferase involved in cell wall biosynthesis
MPKILYLITELDIGGAERNLFRLATALKGRGWDVEAAALSGRGEVGKWLAGAGVPVHYVDMDCKASPAAFARLVGTIRRARPDVLHTFLFHANVAGRLATIFAPVPAVVSSIRVAERRRPSHLRMDYLTQRLADAEICVSEGVRDFAIKRAHIRADKLVVIPNPVETPLPARTRAQVRAEIGAAEGDVVVLSVGRLDVQKGYVYLVAAAAELRKSNARAMFVIAGEGSARGELEKAISDASLGARFKLLGWRADAADLYAAADAFVLPSLWEGMSNALLEAMAAGLPAIATDVEGSGEIIENGRTGILVPPGDSHALAGALAGLLRDETVRKRIASEGQRHVLEHHCVEGFVDAHEQLYRRLLDAARGQGTTNGKTRD